MKNILFLALAVNAPMTTLLIAGEEANIAEKAIAANARATEQERLEMEQLLTNIGTRKFEKKETKSYYELTTQHKAEMATPLAEIYPNAQKLIDKGDLALIPLAKYKAKFVDRSLDEYMAATRALTKMVGGDKISEFYAALANQVQAPEEKELYLKASKRFAPPNSASETK